MCAFPRSRRCVAARFSIDRHMAVQRSRSRMASSRACAARCATRGPWVRSTDPPKYEEIRPGPPSDAVPAASSAPLVCAGGYSVCPAHEPKRCGVLLVADRNFVYRGIHAYVNTTDLATAIGQDGAVSRSRRAPRTDSPPKAGEPLRGGAPRVDLNFGRWTQQFPSLHTPVASAKVWKWRDRP
jgi:hypothetical protein